MPNSRGKRQKDLENLVNEIILSDEDYIGSDEETVRSKINTLLGTLNGIFNDNKFRPHYFFIFDLLDKKPWNSLTTPIAFIKVIEEFLHSDNTLCAEDGNYNEIKKYLDDSEFRYNVDMFISALKYELMVRKSISKSENDIAECENNISDITNAPQEAINNHIEEYNTTLSAYKEEFNGYLQESKNNLETAKNEYSKAKDALSKTTEDLHETRKEISDTRAEMSSLTTNMLTILGIFVSIIFIIVGAYFTVTGELFNKSISSIIQVNLGRFILMGHILINLLFVFMFMISRLSSKNISVICRGCNDSVCVNGKCGFSQRLIKKYPYIVYSNVILSGSYIVLFGWWLIEYFAYQYIADFLSKFVLAYPKLFILGVVVIVIILFFVPILCCLSLSKDK